MKRKIICGIACFIAMLLAYFCYNFLPDQVAVQVAFDGTINRTLPKLLVTIIPCVIALFGSIMYLFANKDNEKYMGMAVVCDMAMILALILNH